ncbi:MAG: DUF2785 domain-containing protein [Defluviitaleaceae bacterium]|nr:DUF2785 domain-containing protein [Defluviitaleaceae bacterium]
MDLKKLLHDMEQAYLYGKIDIPALIAELGEDEFVKLLLDNTGSPNSLLRENILGLLELDYLSNESCVQILNSFLSDSHLFNGLGKQGDDSVFWRSFTSLGIGYLVEHGVDKGFLTEKLYMTALQKSIDYMKREVDRRGYVAGKGWAHAASHGADMLCGVVKCPLFPIAFAKEILECVKIHMLCGHSFTDMDEKRLAAVVLALVEKGLDTTIITEWLNSLIPHITVPTYTDPHHSYVKTLFTIKTFVISLHFILGDEAATAGLRLFIREYESSLWKKAHNQQAV